MLIQELRHQGLRLAELPGLRNKSRVRRLEVLYQGVDSSAYDRAVLHTKQDCILFMSQVRQSGWHIIRIKSTITEESGEVYIPREHTEEPVE